MVLSTQTLQYTTSFLKSLFRKCGSVLCLDFVSLSNPTDVLMVIYMSSHKVAGL